MKINKISAIFMSSYLFIIGCADDITPIDLHPGFCEEKKESNNGTVNGITYRIYDENDKIIREEGDSGADGIIDRVREYFYGVHGIDIYVSSLYDSTQPDRIYVQTKKYYTYNNEGLLISEQITDGLTGEQGGAFIYEYDNGLLTRETNRSPDGEEMLRSTYEYDTEGQIILRSRYNDGIKFYEEIFEYNEFGNVVLIRVDTTGEGVFHAQEIFEYDNKQRLIKKSVGSTAVVSQIDTYSYDGNDTSPSLNLFFAIAYSADVAMTRKRYEYDSGGNLLSVATDSPFEDKSYGRRLYSYDCFD